MDINFLGGKLIETITQNHIKLRTDIEYSLSKFAIFHTFSEFVHVAIQWTKIN